MDVERVGAPTFTLTVNLREMRLLTVAMDMLGNEARDTPKHPLSRELQGEYDDLYYELTSEGVGVDEDTAETLDALGIEARGDSE
jgi:ribosomal protein S7